MIAAEEGSVACIEILLNAGADVNAINLRDSVSLKFE